MTTSADPRRVRAFAALAVAGLLLAGCAGAGGSGLGGSSTGGAPAAPAAATGGGNPLFNLFAYGGTTVPPSTVDVRLPDAPCPRVEVIQGRAAERVYAGGRTGQNAALRYQIGVVDVARECVATAEGQNRIKVGVRGRVLIGPAGAPGAVSAPVRFVVRTPSRTFENRVRTASVTVPAGASQGEFTLVEENLVLPLSVGDNFLIEVGIDR